MTNEAKILRIKGSAKALMDLIEEMEFEEEGKDDMPKLSKMTDEV